ncbi:hypothetical protein P9112_005966 [Eukaryota sp. TZLM1-RC]
MPEPVSDTNGVKRKNDRKQDVEDLSTPPPQPLLSSIWDKKFLMKMKFVQKRRHALRDAQIVDNKDIMLEPVPVLEKMMWQILKQNAKENLLEEQNLRKNQ